MLMSHTHHHHHQHILQSILLSIIPSGHNNLIIRTPHHFIPTVTKQVLYTLSSLLAYNPTHKLKLRNPPPDIQSFIHSLFIPNQNTKQPSLQFVNTATHGPIPGDDHINISPFGNISPNDHEQPTLALANQTSTLQLPRALVVSGLEHLGIPAQRALVSVLAEGRVILETDQISTSDNDDKNSFRPPDLRGKRKRIRNEKGKGRRISPNNIIQSRSTTSWNLPDGFIIVYVCSFDPRECPPIHKSLLDRFSMSVTIPSIPHEILHHPPSSSSSSSSPSLSLPPLSQPQPSPPFPPPFLQRLRDSYNKTYLSPSLSLYISDIFSAARHHNELDGRLLTLRARTDAHSLIRASRVLGLSREFTVPLTPKKNTENDNENDNTKDEHEEEDGVHMDFNFDLDHYPLSSDTHVLDVSEADVARITPRVLSHRLRVLDSPEDEPLATAVFGAVGKKDFHWERRTVKDILIQILSEV